jgi:hypothetical protein
MDIFHRITYPPTRNLINNCTCRYNIPAPDALPAPTTTDQEEDPRPFNYEPTSSLYAWNQAQPSRPFVANYRETMHHPDEDEFNPISNRRDSDLVPGPSSQGVSSNEVPPEHEFLLQRKVWT